MGAEVNLQLLSPIHPHAPASFVGTSCLQGSPAMQLPRRGSVPAPHSTHNGRKETGKAAKHRLLLRFHIFALYLIARPAQVAVGI